MQAALAETEVANYSDSIAIRGNVPQPRQFGRKELLAMAHTNVGPTTITCYSGRHIRDVNRLRGVRLTALLDAAGMNTLPRSQCKQLVIAVRAADGYVCLFTWHELYNSPIGEGAMVIVEQDGEVLPAATGGLQLISLCDLRLGPRHAAGVDQIEVRRWNTATQCG